jgi:hypothetical protein
MPLHRLPPFGFPLEVYIEYLTNELCHDLSNLLRYSSTLGIAKEIPCKTTCIG